MFGYRNETSRTFLGRFGNFTVSFVMGVVEEVSSNITNIAHANAAEIPVQPIEEIQVQPALEIPLKGFQGLNLTPQNIATSSVIIGSKVIKNKGFALISGASPSVFLF